jgi:predicted Zn-dependent protease
MKKLLSLGLLVFVLGASAQNIQVQNMVNYLRNKDYPKAMAAADAASTHESTINSAKMWKYRGDVYKAVYDTSARDQLDKEAEEKALAAYIRCLELDKGKDVYKDDVKGSLANAAATTRKKITYYKYETKEYDKAIAACDLLEKAIPFDFVGNIKRNNITKEKMMYEKFDLYRLAGKQDKMKEMADQLIAMNYKEPKLFTEMMAVSLRNKDTAQALGYIEKGKVLFEDNMDLVGTEIDIYLSRRRTDVLKDRLNKAIELDPENDVLYSVLGQVYDKTGDPANAEKNYLKAAELKPESETVNYRLGAFYFNSGAEYNKKLKDLGPKDMAKADEIEKKVKEQFTKAAPYLEKAYALKPEEAYRQRLFQVHTRLGNTDKAALYRPQQKTKQ